MLTFRLLFRWANIVPFQFQPHSFQAVAIFLGDILAGVEVQVVQSRMPFGKVQMLAPERSVLARQMYSTPLMSCIRSKPTSLKPSRG